jgi:hypothetical protein
MVTICNGSNPISASGRIINALPGTREILQPRCCARATPDCHRPTAIPPQHPPAGEKAPSPCSWLRPDCFTPGWPQRPSSRFPETIGNSEFTVMKCYTNGMSRYTFQTGVNSARRGAIRRDARRAVGSMRSGTFRITGHSVWPIVRS